ncbi:MAG: class I SAM-dependent methyltransferase [Acidimicrobiia bacterium]|nr:class I SAM-dependent methyltransferase [Acidimicrobiia bacterium]
MLELGCGGAQWSVALAACGARPVGLDLSSGQLAHARRHADAARVAVPLVQASGEAVPLRDAGFDVVFADHGAPSFCEPGRLVAEAARVLRPGGRFAFCATTPLVYLTWDQRRERQSRKLRRGAFGRRRFAFGEGTVDFVPSTGEWIRLFRRHGLTVEDVVELRPSEGATTTYVDFVPYRWARRWPAEQVWVTSRQR